MTPEFISKIAIWRERSNNGTLTEAEMIEFIELLRGNRRTASVSSEQTRRTKAKIAIPAADDLLKELGDL